MDCIFCEFITRKRTKHLNGFPFKILNETKNTVSFLAIDFPSTEDGHVLVIPKKHFSNVEDIPKSTQHELIDHVSSIICAIRKNHESVNVLLNDGKSAGQCVFHSHFHIIPRDKGDKIKIEIWNRKKMTESEFLKLHQKIKKEIK